MGSQSVSLTLNFLPDPACLGTNFGFPVTLLSRLDRRYKTFGRCVSGKKMKRMMNANPATPAKIQLGAVQPKRMAAYPPMKGVRVGPRTAPIA